MSHPGRTYPLCICFLQVLDSARREYRHFWRVLPEEPDGLELERRLGLPGDHRLALDRLRARPRDRAVDLAEDGGGRRPPHADS